MNQKRKVFTILSALTLAGTWGATAWAQGEVYTLNPVVVTAQRVEKKDLDTPANVEVVTAKDIEEKGYKNAFDAIQSQLGVESTGYGDAGQDFGLSSGRTVVRGYDRGTLVMVNGIPMNLAGYNSLKGIPEEMIEKVEVVKGAAGTLYGAEAMGGLVNIITKTPEEGKEHVTVKGTAGNYYNDYGIMYTGPRMIVDLKRSFDDRRTHSNDYGAGSDTDWWVGKGQSNQAAIAAKLTDDIGFNMMYQEGDITRGGHKYGKTANASKDYNYVYDDKRMTAGFNYAGKDNGVKAVLGYNYRSVRGTDRLKNERVDSSANLSSYIGDIQKTWEFGEDSLTAGYTFKRENYENVVRDNQNVHRMNHALYLSYTDVFSPKFSATIGLRGERILDPFKNQNVFTPQIQTLYKINDSTSWYIDVGRGFQMPSFSSIFYRKPGSKGLNPQNLKPEKGWTYETGIKKEFNDNQSFKVSIYYMDFKNKFGWSNVDPKTGLQYAKNKGNFRNTGVEFAYEQKLNPHWDYALGFGFSNPEIKDVSQKNAHWIQDSSRIDGVMSLTYRSDKVRSTLSWKYLGDREDYTSRPSKDKQIPSLSRVTWNTIYDVTKNDSVTVTLNNLFDHKNYSNRYGNLDLPYNWRISYSHKF